MSVESSELLSSKVSTLSASEDCIELTLRAYAKVILHAAKYPHAAVNGVLLAKLPAKDEAKPLKLVFTDAIPLFHQTQGLSPMLEVALTQIESHANSAGMGIAGYYHANRHFQENSVDVFSQKIADRIVDLSPLGRAALLTVDNRRISLNLQNHALLGQICNSDRPGNWKSVSNRSIRVDELAFEKTSSLLQTRGYKELFDFDNHLDDVSQDYLNVSLNVEIDR